MADDLTGLYIEAYHAELARDKEQTNSVLTELVDDCGQFVGDKLHVPWIGTNEATDMTRTDSVEMGELASGYKEIVPVPKKHTHPLYDLDKNMHTVAAAAKVAAKTKAALMRAKDAVIYGSLSALVSGTSAGEVFTVGAYTERLTWKMIAEAANYLGDKDAWIEGEMGIILPFSAGVSLGMDLNVAHANNADAAIVKDIGGMFSPLRALKAGIYNKINKPAAGTGIVGGDIYLFAKDAVACAHNANYERIDQQLDGGKPGRTIGAWTRMGAIARDPSAIVRIKYQYNAAVEYEPLQTHAVT